MAEEVVLRLRGSSEELVRAAEAARAAIRGVGVEVDQIDGKVTKLASLQKITDIGQGFQTMGRALTLGVTTPLVGLGAAAIKVASDFDSAFSNVRKTLGDNTTPAQLAKIRTELIALSEQIPRTTEELANIAALGGQFGISAQGIVGFTKTIADLGVAVDGISAEQAAQELAQIRISAGESEENISRMASSLVALGNAGASSEAQILDFTQRLSGAGKEARLQTSEMFALGATLANIGLNAESGGTAFSRTMSSMVKAVDLGGTKLEAFAKIAGMAGDEFVKAFKERPAEAIEAFITGLGTMRASGENMTLALGDLGVEAMREMDMLKRLATAANATGNEQGKLANQIRVSAKAFAEGNAHTKEAAEKYKTLENQLTLLWNVAKNLLRPIGEDMVEAIKKVLPFVTGLFQAAKSLTQAFADLPASIQAGVFGAVGLVAIAGPALYVTGSLIQAGTSVYRMIAALRELQKVQAVTTMTGIGTAAAGASTGVWSLAGAFSALGVAIGVGTAVGGIAFGLFKIGEALVNFTKYVEQAKTPIEALQRSLQFLSRNANTGQSLFFNDVGRTPGAGSRTLQSSPFMPGGQTFGGGGGEFQMQRPEPITFSGGRGPAAMSDGFTVASARAKQYAEDLTRVGKAAFETMAREHELGVSVSDLSSQFKVSEASIERYIKLKQESAAESAKHAKAEKKSTEDIVKYQKGMREAVKFLDLENTRERAKLLEERGRQERLIFQRDTDQWIAAHEERRDHERRMLELSEELEADSLEKRLRILKRGFHDQRNELDHRSEFFIKNLSEINAAEAAAAAAATDEWRQHIADLEREMPSVHKVFQSVLEDIPDLIAAAFTGGGGFSGALTAVASKLGSGLMSQMFSDPEGLGQTFASGLVNLFGGEVGGKMAAMMGPVAAALGSLAGPMLGKMMSSSNRAVSVLGQAGSWALAGAAFGPWGAAIGGVAGAVAGLVQTAGKGRDAIEEFANSFGGFDVLHSKLLTMGEQGEILWRTMTQGVGNNNPEQAARAIHEITEAFQEQQQLFTTHNKSLSEMLGAVQGIGERLPQSMAPYIEQLHAAKLLTDENAAALTGMLTSNNASFQQMEATAKQYGIELSALGSTFQQQKLTHTATEIIRAFEGLVANGADFNGVLRGMKDEINAVVIDSLKFQTEIPANMRPWIAKLIESGELLDENGQKITDISTLKFGEEIQVGLSDVVAKLQEMIDLMRGVPAAIGGVGRGLRENKGVWDEWRHHALEAAREVGDEVDRISVGSSPGGLKDISLYLARAEDSMESFRRVAVANLREVNSTINGISVQTPSLAAASAGRAPQAIHLHIMGRDERELKEVIHTIGQENLTDRRWQIPIDTVIDVTTQRG